MDFNWIDNTLKKLTINNINRSRVLVLVVYFLNISFVAGALAGTILLKNGWMLWFVWFDFLIFSCIFIEYSFIMPFVFIPLSALLFYACGFSLTSGDVTVLPFFSGLCLDSLFFLVDNVFCLGENGAISYIKIYGGWVWASCLLAVTVKIYKFIIHAPYICCGVALFFPLFSSIILLLSGKKIGNKYAGIFSSYMVSAAAANAIFFWIIYPICSLKVASYLVKAFQKQYYFHKGFIERVFADPFAAKFPWDIVETSLDYHYRWFEASKTFLGYNVNNPDMIQLFTKTDPELFFNFGNIVSYYSMHFSWALKFDNLTLVMFSVILFISATVHIFSCDYMRSDAHQVRFFSFLSLFTFFMLLLVCAYDFIVFYIAWEGVGICSFLLISFWFSRVQAIKAAIKALLVNKVGDVSLLLGGAVIFKCCSSLDFGVIFFLFPVTGNELLNNSSFNHIDLACLLLLIASLVKSAQLFFHIWLADAMEGPTPVSALLHAATMVTAGVFLVIRFSFIFEYSPSVLNFLTYISVFSILIISIIGMFQYDLKKIIAYSTCSQLGIMFLACSLSGYTFALFHFFNHAFFKALMFMSAGNIIHALDNEQDIRKMGGLKKILPFSYMTFLISSLSLVGFPFFSGYYSKDAIIFLAYSKLVATAENPSPVLYYVILASLFLTCFYSFRVIYYVFLGNSTRISKHLHKKVKENINFYNAGPLFILALLSISSGSFFNSYFIGVGTDFFYEASILTFCDDVKYYLFWKEVKRHILFALVFSYVLCILFCYFKEARGNWSFKFYHHKKLRDFFSFFNKKGYFDDLYNLFINSKIYKLGYDVYVLIDKGLLEIFGPRGFGRAVQKISIIFKKSFNRGPITHLIYLMILGTILLLLVVLLILV